MRRLVVGSGGWAAYARLAAGLGLLVTALLLFAVQTGQLRVAQDIVVAATLGVAVKYREDGARVRASLDRLMAR